MGWPAALATIGASLIGANAIKSSAPKQAGTQTTKTEAPDYILPQYRQLAGDIEALRTTGLLGDVQTLSPYERSLVESGMARAVQADPFQAAGKRAVSQLLGGGGLLGEAANIYRDIGASDSGIGSPAFEAATQRAVERSLRPITSQYARGGRLGSGLMGTAIGETAAQTVGDIMSQAAQQDIENRMRAAAGLGGLAGQRTSDIGAGLTGAGVVGDMPFTNIQRGLGLGGLLSREAFELSQRPVREVQQMADILRGATVGSQQTQPLYAPQAGTGALLGASLIQAAPQIGQAFGSAFTPSATIPTSTPMNLGGGQTYQQTSAGRFVNPAIASAFGRP